MNVVLIGMPGVGKSTVGVLLAKRLGLEFVDTDVRLQARAGRPLQRIVDEEGYRALRRWEARTILALRARRAVIATGGSAVYSAAAMRHLRKAGRLVFLDASLSLIRKRVRDEATRGLARRPGQTLADLYAERRPLYRRHADLTVPIKPSLTHDQAAAAIIAALAAPGAGACAPAVRPWAGSVARPDILILVSCTSGSKSGSGSKSRKRPHFEPIRPRSR